MRHSLRLRLLLMTGIVLAVAIAAVAFFSSRITTRQFDRYIASDRETNLERYRAALTQHYQTHAGWDGVQTTLEQVGAIAGKALILVDAERKVLAATPRQMTRASIDVAPNHRVGYEWHETVDAGQGRQEARVEKGVLMNPPHVVLTNAQNEPVGTLYVVPHGEAAQGNESVFVGAVNRSLLWAGLLAGAAALLVTFALARRILGPIEALTSVVRRMERGDLSERVAVQANDEIGELARAFNAMADGLARTEQLRRNMVSDIAHELRSPLTNLRCQIEALQDGLVAPSASTFHSLHEEAMLLKRLIDDLQELALAEAGQLRLELVPMQVRDVVQQVVAAYASQAAEKTIALNATVPTDLPAIYADPERVGQILRNLLANALAHTPPAGRIEIGARLVADQVEIRVANTGAGIAPEHLPNLFERFYRADSSRTRATGGAGLGLAIVKQLVEAQGGRAWAESELGQSAVFIVSLPKAKTTTPQN
ncbi:MAG TPA: ATP-binding protein [Blastocatellia bacterium]|nr:ATP-binding protein [Blastocatellia bacterium]